MTNNTLNHIAIIMDGNGRWAKKRGLARNMGHRKGAEVVVEIAKSAKELGVKYLTLYAFSTAASNTRTAAAQTDAGTVQNLRYPLGASALSLSRGSDGRNDRRDRGGA